MTNHKFWMTAACVAGCLCVATATVAQEVKSAGAVGEAVSVTATVTKIDQKTRAITLKAENGQKYSFVAGPAVANLPQVKKGDRVTVAYAEALVYEIRSGGKPGTSVAAGAIAAPAGAKPAGAVAAQVTATVKITAIDPKVPSVTVAMAAGETETFKVSDAAKLQGVKSGDTVAITYTEAIALKVEPKAKK